MKIVINGCFGGFGLSPIGLKRYAELKGRQCYFFRSARNKDGGISLDRYEGPISLEEAMEESVFFHAFDIPNPNEVVAFPDEWHSLSIEEKQKFNDAYSAHCFSSSNISRTDPHLIQVIEEIGGGHRTGASGKFANLKIVEIPDGIDYEIDEYDGNEHVAEKHRTWS